MTETVRIGTRGSLLAWTQAGHARSLMARAHPGTRFELEKISTRGDRDRTTPLVSMAGTGLFTKELEEALLDGRIDLAVHSLKDVPYETASGCVLAAFLERESPWDALLTTHAGWDELPQGGLVGTSSPRRIAQLRSARPDLRFSDLRGNLDTRISRLEKGEFDAVVLASAGLRRLGWERKIRALLPAELCVPAFGQGVLVAECRADDQRILELLARLDKPSVRRAAQLERRLMRALGGGCKAALAAYCAPSDEGWQIWASLGDPLRAIVLRRTWSGGDCEADAALDALAYGLLEEAKDAGLSWN